MASAENRLEQNIIHKKLKNNPFLIVEITQKFLEKNRG